MEDGMESKDMGQVIQLNKARMRTHLGEMIRGTILIVLHRLVRLEC